MEEVKKPSEPTGMALVRAVTKEVMKLITEHGISRVLVAVGIIIPICFLVRIPSESWQINVLLLVGSAVMIIVGALIRIFEMKHRLFSGRAVLLRCSNPKCRLPITEAFKFDGNPPQPIQCNHCKAINIIQ